MSRSLTAAPRDLDGGAQTLARKPARRHRHDDQLDLAFGAALGEVDRMSHRLLGIDEVDDVAGLHAERLGVAEPDHLDRVAATPQHVLRRLRFQPADQAGDLAGADVERRDERACAAAPPASSSASGRDRVGSCVAALGFSVAFFLAASSRAWAAASDSRTVTRSGSRRSIAATSRLDSLLSRSSAAS